jgi:hypothetical protein
MMFLVRTDRAAPVLLAVSLLAGFAASSPAAEVAVRGYTFRVPEGFTVKPAAEAPLVKYPICVDFDERGRLYVCESSGTAEWNKLQPKETLHRVTRLEDSDGDGVFDRRTTFAEFEMMAQGSMWLDGSLYVAAAPVIWKLTDTDDDGIAEQREEWIKTEAVTGCLNDIRGPYLGPDGYIYWCKGPATQTYSVDGRPWTGRVQRGTFCGATRRAKAAITFWSAAWITRSRLPLRQTANGSSRARIFKCSASRATMAFCTPSTGRSIRKISPPSSSSPGRAPI